jgi:hypothetical protein
MNFKKEKMKSIEKLKCLNFKLNKKKFYGVNGINNTIILKFNQRLGIRGLFMTEMIKVKKVEHCMKIPITVQNMEPNKKRAKN